jgi:hypothetical protein
LIASSQTVTQNTTRNDSTINLPKPVAKAVVTDIIRGDSARAILSILSQNNSTLSTNLMLKDYIIQSKDSIISLYQARDTNYQNIINIKDKNILKYQKMYDSQYEISKMYKQKNTSKTVLIIGLAVTFAAFIIFKK